MALPKELNHGQQRKLLTNFVQEQFVDRGMIANIAIHRDDENDPHAHVLLTTREISEKGFEGKNRDWDKKELLEQWREQWSEHANRALEKAGTKDRITHLSHKDRGLEILPTVHLGHVAHEMESKGKGSSRGTINAELKAYNAVVIDLQKYREEKEALQHRIVQQYRLNSLSTPEKNGFP